MKLDASVSKLGLNFCGICFVFLHLEPSVVFQVVVSFCEELWGLCFVSKIVATFTENREF